MNKSEVIDLLKDGLNNETLHNSIVSALTLIDNSQNISIGDHRRAVGEDRNSLLALYRKRDALLKKRKGPEIEGFEATIRSLAEQNCERVQIVIVELKDSHLIVSILVGPNGVPIGCKILRDKRKQF